ncbi:MAG TPA: hypothetical protein V6D06_13720, partial [Trichocoleus sp.]
MRVMFVTGAYRPERCGVADYTAHLRQHLDKAGVASTVLTTHAAAEAVRDSIEDCSVYGAVADWKLPSLL